jgi:hypothetical protein
MHIITKNSESKNKKSYIEMVNGTMLERGLVDGIMMTKPSTTKMEI